MILRTPTFVARSSHMGRTPLANDTSKGVRSVRQTAGQLAEAPQLDLLCDLSVGESCQERGHIRTTVQPVGKVEFTGPEWETGQTVDEVLHPTNNDIKRRMG